MQLNEERYYKHSGAFSISGIVSMLTVGVIVALAGGALYGFLNGLIPFIYFVFFLAVGTGFLAGISTGFIAKLFKIRNMFAVAATAFLVGIVAVYASWVTWIYFSSDFTMLTFSPLDILDVMSNVSEKGLWSIFGWTPKGWALYLIWLIEAGLITLISMGIAYSHLDEKAFCEMCNLWAEEKTEYGPFAPIESDITEFVTKLEENRYEVLTELKKIAEEELLYLKIEVNQCSMCHDATYMSIKVVTVEFDDKNERSEDSDNILLNLIVPRGITEALKKINDQPVEVDTTEEADVGEPAPPDAE